MHSTASLNSTATPNHALQRTAPCVTAPASAAAFPPTMQVPRRTPLSLSLGSLGVATRLVKFALCFLSLFATLAVSFAGEAGLIQTFQPLNGFESGEVSIASVSCYASNTHVGWHQAIRYITAKYVPPSLQAKPVGDINLASRCGISLWAGDGADGRITITLDFTTLKMPHDFVYTERQVTIGTLECLRRVAGDKLNTTPIETKFKPKGQEATKELVSAFMKHPKDKEFQPE